MSMAFGLDLAGYSTQGSALAVAERTDKTIAVTVLEGNCFAKAAKGKSVLTDMANKEIECLRTMFKHAPIYIDVPIDLQDLPSPPDSKFIWQLTQRPVDKAFDGMCPLANLIGSYVARMKNLWCQLCSSGEDPLGKHMFETYPAASLRLINLDCEGYKGHCVYSDSGWIGRPEAKAKQKKQKKAEAEQKKNDALAKLLTALRWTATRDFSLNHDEFDAALCSLAGVNDQLSGEELNQKINELLGTERLIAPRGYVLLKEKPLVVHIQRKPYSASDWY